MKEVWRRTLELILRYPVLWLPVIWAALLSYGWQQLRSILLHDVLPLIFRKQSVLGGYVPDTSHTKAVEFYILALINTNVFGFADVTCYCVALLMTAKMLGRLTSVTNEDNPYAKISFASHSSGVLKLGLLAYVLAWVFGPLVYAPVLYSAEATHRTSILTRPYVGAIGAAFMYSMLAYFVTPAALRLLAQPRQDAIDSRFISMGRKCSMASGAALTLLSAIQVSLHEPYLQALPARAAYGILVTVFGALPYAGLFIALSLVAAASTFRDSDFSVEKMPAEFSSLTKAESEI